MMDFVRLPVVAMLLLLAAGCVSVAYEPLCELKPEEIDYLKTRVHTIKYLCGNPPVGHVEAGYFPKSVAWIERTLGDKGYRTERIDLDSDWEEYFRVQTESSTCCGTFDLEIRGLLPLKDGEAFLWVCHWDMSYKGMGLTYAREGKAGKVGYRGVIPAATAQRESTSTGPTEQSDTGIVSAQLYIQSSHSGPVYARLFKYDPGELEDVISRALGGIPDRGNGK